MGRQGAVLGAGSIFGRHLKFRVQGHLRRVDLCMGLESGESQWAVWEWCRLWMERVLRGMESGQEAAGRLAAAGI